jgi:Virulence factor BrkB
MNRIEATLRGVDRYQQRHPLVGVPFAVVKKLGDDKGGNLITLLAWNGFFALLPLLLVLVTLLGHLLRRNPAMRQQVLDSAFAEFPIIGDQLQSNLHSLHTNGFGLVVGIAGSLWGAKGVTQAGQHAMAEIWNIPGKERPSFWTRQVRGLALLLVLPSAWSPRPCSPGSGAWATARPSSGWPTWPPPPGSTSGCSYWGSGSSPQGRSPFAGSWRGRWSPGSAGRRCWPPPAATWSATT